MLSLETNNQAQASTSSTRKVLVAAACTATVGAVLAFGLTGSGSSVESALNRIPEDFKGSFSASEYDGTYEIRGVFHKFENELGDWQIDGKAEARGTRIEGHHTFNMQNNTITTSQYAYDGDLEIAMCFNKARWPQYGAFQQSLEDSVAMEFAEVTPSVQNGVERMCSKDSQIYHLKFGHQPFVVCPEKSVEGFSMGVMSQVFSARITQDDSLEIDLTRSEPEAELNCTKWDPKGVKYTFYANVEKNEREMGFRTKDAEAEKQELLKESTIEWPFVIANDVKPAAAEKFVERRLEEQTSFEFTVPLACTPEKPKGAPESGYGNWTPGPDFDPDQCQVGACCTKDGGMCKYEYMKGDQGRHPQEYLDAIRGFQEDSEWSFLLHKDKYGMSAKEYYARNKDTSRCTGALVQQLANTFAQLTGGDVMMKEMTKTGVTYTVTGVKWDDFASKTKTYEEESEMKRKKESTWWEDNAPMPSAGRKLFMMDTGSFGAGGFFAGYSSSSISGGGCGGAYNYNNYYRRRLCQNVISYDWGGGGGSGWSGRYPTPQPTNTGIWPDTDCIMIHGAGEVGFETSSGLTRSAIKANTGLYHGLIRSPFDMAPLGTEEANWHYWGVHSTEYMHQRSNTESKRSKYLETCANWIGMEADSRTRGYFNSEYQVEICEVIENSPNPDERAKSIFTHSNGGPSTAKVFVKGYCNRGEKILCYSNAPLHGSQGANFAHWACGNANQLIGAALSALFSMITNWFVKAFITLLIVVLFPLIILYRFSNIGNMLIQSMGGYCKPNVQPRSVSIFLLGNKKWKICTVSWDQYLPSVQSTVYEALNISDSAVSRFRRRGHRANLNWFSGECLNYPGDPTGCDIKNNIIGTYGTLFRDFNRHDNDDPGATGWGLFNDDDDHNSGFTVFTSGQLSDDGLDGSFWRRSRPATPYYGIQVRSGLRYPYAAVPNYSSPALARGGQTHYATASKHKSHGRLCGFSAMGSAVGMSIGVWGVGLLARMNVHWDHWCINWGPWNQFCKHRGCHNTLGLGCVDWIGAMDSHDGMVNSVSCAYGYSHQGGTPMKPNGLGITSMPHPKHGQRSITMQPSNHEDGTGRNGHSWLNDSRYGATDARDGRKWLFQYAQWYAKEAKVKWCTNNNHGHQGAANGWTWHSQCQALNDAPSTTWYRDDSNADADSR